MTSIIEELLVSPSPYLIFGNPTQDPDSLSCCLAMYHLLAPYGAAIYISDGSIHDSLKWMLEPIAFNGVQYFSPVFSKGLENYGTYVVVDQTIVRCPEFVKTSAIKKVVVDHHFSAFPDEVKNASDCVLHRIVDKDQNLVNYFKVAPSAASILVEENILHPHLWYGIWSDTVGLSVNQVEAIDSAYLCKQKLGFSNNDFDWYQEKVESVLPIDSLAEFLASNIYMVEGKLEDKPFSLIFAVVKPKIDKAIHTAILNFLRKFSDVTCLVNSEERMVSLRSRSYDVSEFASRRGGGGHIRAAGFQIPEPDSRLPFKNQSHLSIYYALLEHFKIDNAHVRELSYHG
jgi:hypothetical protein